MAIAPISALNSYMPTTSVQPMNYAVDNEAGFSDVYTNESVKNGSSVTGATPVQYPNARLEAASAFNEIAAQYKSNNIGYNKAGIGNSYGMVGSRFDAFA